MGELSSVSKLTFFYHANPGTERANVLTYLEVAQKDDYRRELFYLRRCYTNGFLYTENKALDDFEIYSASMDIVWGISPEAAACLVCPSRGRQDFLQTTFYTNFNAQYLFMYVLLLHQKYVLYMFMTRINAGTYRDLDTLEDYRNQLYLFETDFVYSCVTEVPQYQQLYDRMTEAFSLKKMFDDVHEPLVSLHEIRQKAAADEQEKRDTNINKALFLFSLLSLFSALIDSVSFVSSVGEWFSGSLSAVIVAFQILCTLITLVIGGNVIMQLVKEKRRKKGRSSGNSRSDLRQ